MESYKIGFIGTGNMGGALATAVCRAVTGENVLLCDKNTEKASELASRTGARAVDINTIASECRYIFLGVKPQMLSDTIEEISDILKSRKDKFILVSMAAGVSVEKINLYADAWYPIIRIMPNTAVEVGEGMILYTVNSLVDPSSEKDFLGFMSAAGELDKLPENLIDAGCAVSGCGPAFVYMFIEAMADGGVKCGLSRAAAVKYAEQTLIGAAKLGKVSGRHPEELKDAVCSPAGSTIAGTFALEKGGFRASIIDAVNAAFERTKELGK